jgi:hypothetical protein
MSYVICQFIAHHLLLVGSFGRLEVETEMSVHVPDSDGFPVQSAYLYDIKLDIKSVKASRHANSRELGEPEKQRGRRPGEYGWEMRE